MTHRTIVTNMRQDVFGDILDALSIVFPNNKKNRTLTLMFKARLVNFFSGVF